MIVHTPVISAAAVLSKGKVYEPIDASNFFKRVHVSHKSNAYCPRNSQEEVFQCEVCGRHFINRKALALHRIHHENGTKNKPPQEKSFLCDVCARGFSTK